eukprot:gnl/Spiro4/24213_TR12024_c0_g1_i1.p1 gnl/Spiro4/24213_TR12024_c0_g1~~gnl/Spiro4/24213_TR12024_c0_g1_i1.p1  ORF type:complete len:173 (+),score=25.77 gnl/Spiro4/24213_TR12024_c0_g1_i1:44-520(+)
MGGTQTAETVTTPLVSGLKVACGSKACQHHCLGSLQRCCNCLRASNPCAICSSQQRSNKSKKPTTTAAALRSAVSAATTPSSTTNTSTTASSTSQTQTEPHTQTQTETEQVVTQRKDPSEPPDHPAVGTRVRGCAMVPPRQVAALEAGGPEVLCLAPL